MNIRVLKGAAIYGRERAQRENLEISFGMTTNGVLLSRDIAHFLNEMHIRVMLSLDGRRKVHESNRRKLVECKELKPNCKKKGLSKDFKGGCFADNYVETWNIFDPSIQAYRFQKVLDGVRRHLRRDAYSTKN